MCRWDCPSLVTWGWRKSALDSNKCTWKRSLLCTQDLIRSHGIIKLTQSRKESLEELGNKGMFLSFYMLVDWKFQVYWWLCSYRFLIAHSNWAACDFLYLRDWFLVSLKEVLKHASTEKCLAAFAISISIMVLTQLILSTNFFSTVTMIVIRHLVTFKILFQAMATTVPWGIDVLIILCLPFYSLQYSIKAQVVDVSHLSSLVQPCSFSCFSLPYSVLICR